MAPPSKIAKDKKSSVKKPKKRFDRRINLKAVGYLVGIVSLLAVLALGWNFYRNSNLEQTAIDQAKQSAERKNIELAIRHLDRYLADHPDSVRALDLKAKYLTESAQSFDRLLLAANVLDRLIKLDPNGEGRLESRRKLAAIYIDYSNAVRQIGESRNERESSDLRYVAALKVIKDLLEARDSSGKVNDKDPVAYRLRALAYLGQSVGGEVKSVSDTGVIRDPEADLQKAIELDPRDLLASEALADLYLTRLAEPRKADAILDAMLQRMPESVDVRISRYRAFLRAGQKDKAKAELDAAIALAPKNVNLLIEGASVALGRQDWASVRKYLESIPADVQKDDLKVRVLRGYLEFGESNPDNAIEQWRKGLSLVGGGDLDLTWKLAYNLIQFGRLGEAGPLMVQYNRLAKPKDPLGGYLQGLFDQKSGRIWDSITHLEEIVNKIPTDFKSDVLVSLGRSYELIGEKEKAQIAYQNASLAAPSSSSPRRAFASLIAADDPDRALTELETARNTSPTDKALLSDLIRLKLTRLRNLPQDQRRSKEVDGLLAEFEKIDPNNANLRLMKASYLASTARLGEAVVLLEAAAKGPGRNRPETWIAWAEGLEAANKLDEAIKAIDEGLKPDAAGDHASLRVAKAKLLYRVGNGQAARKTLTDDIDRIAIGERPDLFRELGDILRGLGDRPGARNAYSEWARLSPNSPNPALILLSLGQIDGDDEAARLGLQALRDMGRIEEPYGMAAQALELLRADPSRPGPPPAERINKAEEIVRKLKNKAPGLTEISLIEGMTQEYRNDPESAAKSYLSAIRPGRISPALPRLISLYMNTKNFAELDNLKAKFDIAAGRQSSVTNEFDTMAANLAMRLNDKALTEAYLARIAERRPDDLEFRLTQAQVLDTNQQPKEAEARYRDLVKTFPERPKAWFSLIRFLVTRRERAEVDRAIEEASKNFKGERPELFRARCFLVANDRPAAARGFQEAFEKRPDDLETIQSLIEFKGLLGQSDQTEPLFRRALKLDPKTTWAARGLALLLSAKPDPITWPEAWSLVAPGAPGAGDRPEDRLVQATVLARSPDSARRAEAVKAFVVLANDLPITSPIGIDSRIRLAQEMLGYEKAAEALAYITPLADDIAHPNALAVVIAIEAAARMGNSQEAEQRLDRLTGLVPNSVQLAISRAWVFFAQGKKDEAARSIEAAYQKAESLPDSDPEKVGVTAVDLLMRFENAEAAYPIAQKVAKRWPRQAWTLARVQLARKEYDRVLESCRIALDAGSARDALKIATGAALVRRKDKAFVEKVDAIAEAAKNQDRENVTILIFIATLRHIEERYEDELALYKAVIALKPARMDFLNNMAWTLSEGLNRPEEALKQIEEAIVRDGIYAPYLDTRGVILGRLAKYVPAIADLEASVKLEPSPLTYFHLARVYLKANQTADWKRARDLAMSKGFNPEDLDPTDRADLDLVMGKP